MRIRLLVSIVFLATTAIVRADEERSNEPVVISGMDGTCYARSMPTEILGVKGKTTIFKVGRTKDTPLDTYDWYSFHLHLLCGYLDGRGVMVARMGRWPEGRQANDRDLAIAFYRAGKLVRKYSTLDIAGSPTNVGGSVSHYKVFSEVQGWTWMDDIGGKSCCSVFFVATAFDGRQIRFSPYTGERVPDDPHSASSRPAKNKAPR